MSPARSRESMDSSSGATSRGASPLRLSVISAHGIESRRRPLIAGQQIAQLPKPLFGRQHRPLLYPQALCNDQIVHVRVLSDVEGRKMKTEGAYPAHEAPYQKISRVASPIFQQAVGGEFYVVEQFAGVLIGVGTAFVGRFEPRADLPEVH